MARDHESITAGEANFRVLAPQDAHDEETRLSGDLYLETDFREGEDSHSPALTFYGTVEEESSSAYVGVAFHYPVAELKFGIMGGAIHHHHELHTALNPWVFYEGERVEFLALSEHCLDGEKPDYYRGFIYYKRGILQGGVHGETDFGVGPSLGLAVTRHVTFSFTVPVAERPSPEERAEVLLTMRVHF